MTKQYFAEAYGAKPPVNYERFFVPAIAEPVAHDLMRLADLGPGERVLDVACGTGLGARLAAEAVGSRGAVAGVDVNRDMLAVAQSATPAELSIDWYEMCRDRRGRCLWSWPRRWRDTSDRRRQGS